MNEQATSETKEAPQTARPLLSDELAAREKLLRQCIEHPICNSLSAHPESELVRKITDAVLMNIRKNFELTRKQAANGTELTGTL